MPPWSKLRHRKPAGRIASASPTATTRLRTPSVERMPTCGRLMIGTEISVPIINRPQGGILSTDGVRKRVVSVSDERGDVLAIRPTGFLCLSFDHRAIDGAYAGAFVGRVRAILEDRDWLTEM